VTFKPSPAHVIEARRELARRSFPDFCCMVDIPTVPLSDEADEDKFGVMRLGSLATHHQLLCDALQAVADGRIPNLMVLMPPGSAKSTYVDVLFVPWWMARTGRKNVILASYASDIAKKQGRRARQLLRSPSWKALFPDVELSGHSTAADEWALSNGGEYMAGGLLSGLTGNRAGLGVLDDPIRGREAAESQVIRNKTWDAYIDDYCSRLTPGAPQVMVLTRWQQDDPAGRILPEDWNGESGRFNGRDGRIWHVLCLPAICDRADDPLGRKIGETLWPEWFSLEHWEPFKRNARTWSSLYQQKPSPEEGTYFQRGWFNRYAPEDLPKSLNKYATSDYAVTDGGGDWTVHRIWGVDSDGDIWLLDGWRGQTSADQWIEEKLNLAEKHKPYAWFGEAGVIAKAVEPMLTRRMRERGVYFRMEWITSINDKAARARGFQARAAMGKVWVPEGYAGDQVLDEYLRFPAGKHDDEVDVAGLIGRALDDAHPAVVTTQATTAKKERYARTGNAGVDWKTA